jgi:hypothetical protein
LGTVLRRADVEIQLHRPPPSDTQTMRVRRQQALVLWASINFQPLPGGWRYGARAIDVVAHIAGRVPRLRMLNDELVQGGGHA